MFMAGKWNLTRSVRITKAGRKQKFTLLVGHPPLLLWVMYLISGSCVALPMSIKVMLLSEDHTAPSQRTELITEARSLHRCLLRAPYSKSSASL